MMIRMNPCALTSLLLLWMRPAAAFLTPSAAVRTPLLLSVSSNPYSEGDQIMNHHDDNDDDAIRERLEHILSLTPTSSSAHHHHIHHNDDAKNSHDGLVEQQQDHEQHILTAHRERLLEMELHLLDSLSDSDDGIDTLVDLWIGERGDEASFALHQMERHCSKGLVAEERALRAMIEHYRMEHDEWAEPASRLAVLLFTRGQYEEATQWCYEALRVKPWHFETGQLLVALWLRQENLVMAVRAARAYTLPDLNDATQHKRRRAWVEKNRSILQERLQQSRLASAEIHHDAFFDDEECLGEYCWT